MAISAEELQKKHYADLSCVLKIFPRLTPACLTSEPDAAYNCIAWAVDQKDVWWSPFTKQPGHFWPPDVPRSDDLTSFYLAYGTLEYIPIVEKDIDKYQHVIAIMGVNDKVLHAMKRLPDGRWSSKLGKSFDIIHELHDLEGKTYGQIIGFMGKDKKN